MNVPLAGRLQWIFWLKDGVNIAIWGSLGCLAFHVETWRHVSLLATVGLQGMEFFRKYHQILHPKCGLYLDG